MIGKREKAKFIALEGGEGAGKSTQVKILTERLQANGIQTIQIHEPGTTSLGLHLRTFLKGNDPISPEAEMLLFGASRAQLTDEIIQPKLEQGVTVVADRFEASSMAYQGHARGLVLANVKMINAFATKGIRPDLNILLDMEPNIGLARTKGPQPDTEAEPTETGIRQDSAGTRRFEEQPIEFHQRVRAGYLAQVRTEPQRWTVIDGTMHLELVHEAIWDRVLQILL